jgi:dihydrofolate reductase
MRDGRLVIGLYLAQYLHPKALQERTDTGVNSPERNAVKVRVLCFGVSLDGFGAGPMQDLQNPLGVGGPELFQWFFNSRVWRRMRSLEGGETGIDNQMAERGFEGVGAWILGRNMFGPIRGAWPDESWKGWWGEEPPYHTQVFVLTHHARPALRMQGGTEFHFVTEGIHAALEQARAAAGTSDVRIGGGVATIRQYLKARLIDDLHFAVGRFSWARESRCGATSICRDWATRSPR